MLFTKISDKDGNIILADADGNKAVFEFLEMAVVDGDEFAALLETDTESVVILRLHEMNDGHESYETIDDDALFKKVVQCFEEIFDED
ncbi:MAG: DUF1292 domain-containing protein [Clostridia bacterium]|nr:DUF1292 domain-containing protein [Clostridia bacterium]